jgi:hypothetical protein
LELKRYTVNGKTYTLALKQNLDANWECTGHDPAANEVCKATRPSKRDAKFAAHVTLYELHSLRCDQTCEDDCEQGWEEVKGSLTSK